MKMVADAFGLHLKWQPIETAPRDGTRILILIPAPISQAGQASFLGRVRIARWNLSSFKLDGSGRFLPKEIQGWQPLPAVPAYMHKMKVLSQP